MQEPQVLSTIRDFIFREGHCCPQPLPSPLWEIAPRPPHSSAVLWRAWGALATPVPPWALFPPTTDWRGNRRWGLRSTPVELATGPFIRPVGKKHACSDPTATPCHTGVLLTADLNYMGAGSVWEMLTLQSKAIEHLLIPQKFPFQKSKKKNTKQLVIHRLPCTFLSPTWPSLLF